MLNQFHRIQLRWSSYLANEFLYLQLLQVLNENFVIEKKKEIDLSLFPELNEETKKLNQKASINKEENEFYKEKLNLTLKKKEYVPEYNKNILILKQNPNPIQKLIHIPKENINPYYNPIKSQQIILDRIEMREELNDILGDISPYWDIDIYGLVEENDQEYENQVDKIKKDKKNALNLHFIRQCIVYIQFHSNFYKFLTRCDLSTPVKLLIDCSLSPRYKNFDFLIL